MKSNFQYFLVLCFGVSSLVGQKTDLDHPNSHVPIVEMIHKDGYPVEAHDVTTEDGYILTMFRIPHGKGGSIVNTKPVLVMHGAFEQAEHFIVNGINNGSIAYALADNGYDVWLGNNRGTGHGRKHKYLNPNSKEFWSFTFHEMGLYDIPAKIDYILNTTNKHNLHYMGHSQGGTVFFIMTSLRPEYQKKIVLASLLAPSGYQNHFTNQLLLPLSGIFKQMVELSENLYEFPPPGISTSELLVIFCTFDLYRDLCNEVYHFVLGGNSGEVNENVLPLFVKFVPSCSTKQFLHFASGIVSGHFRPWDFGTKINMKTYGRPVPPDYPLKNITVPTAMYYSLGDNFCSPKDVLNTCKAIQNCVRKYQMRNKKWTHVDFLVSKNLANELMVPLIKFAKKYDEYLY